jgi:hypothetical protein
MIRAAKVDNGAEKLRQFIEDTQPRSPADGYHLQRPGNVDRGERLSRHGEARDERRQRWRQNTKKTGRGGARGARQYSPAT